MVNTAVLLQSNYRPTGVQQLRFPEFLYNRHMKVVRLSALRLYPSPQEVFLVLFLLEAETTLGS